jgi:ABC-type antimicrobial peptide transport system permease subunit
MTRHISKRKIILALTIAVIVGFPLGWIVAMLLTPALWRLEPILKMELAGHSGPSDWVFVVVWGLVAIGFFLLLRRVLSDPKPGQ